MTAVVETARISSPRSFRARLGPFGFEPWCTYVLVTSCLLMGRFIWVTASRSRKDVGAIRNARSSSAMLCFVVSAVAYGIPSRFFLNIILSYPYFSCFAVKLTFIISS